MTIMKVFVAAVRSAGNAVRMIYRKMFDNRSKKMPEEICGADDAAKRVWSLLNIAPCSEQHKDVPDIAHLCPFKRDIFPESRVMCRCCSACTRRCRGATKGVKDG